MLKGEDVNSLLESHDSTIFGHLLSNRKLLLSSSDEQSNKESNEKEKVEEIPSASAAIKPKPKDKLDTNNPKYISYLRHELKYTLLGGLSMNEIDRMRVTLRINIEPLENPLYSLRHSLDLYNDDQVQKLVRKASDRLEVGTRELQIGISELINLLESHRKNHIENISQSQPKKRVLTKERKEKVKAYLSKDNLLKRTNEDIGKTGIVGELKNRLLVYICFTSRLRKTPLHVITLGPSGSGKTYLQEKIAGLIPKEDIIQFTSSTENAMYYFEKGDLRHKLVLCEDLDGAEGVMYTIRELMSKNMISKIVPMKDSKGNQRTVIIEVYGPIVLASTTTRDRLYEDNANRALLITPDSSYEQSERIQAYQRQISSGKINHKLEEQWKDFFKDMQSVLKPIAVRNPYAEKLRIPKACFKPLRTNSHYLHFIEAVTFYHQYQREVKTCEITGEQYIETSLEDIAAANELIEEVLIAKSDELSGACRKFVEQLKTWLKKEGRESFHTKELRLSLRIHPSKLNRYLRELQAYGKVKVIGGNRYSKGLEYELEALKTYEEMRSGIRTILSKILEEIKEEEAKKG